MDNGLMFEELNITPVNPLLSKCTIKVCYVSNEPNRNGSIITKETMNEIANTLPGCPIVGYYNEQTEDFEGHNELIEFDTHTGEIKFKVLTFPYGFVPTDAKVWYQDYEEDGEIRKYLCTEGVIWTGQFPESQKIFNSSNGKGQSMEFDEESMVSLYNMKNGCMIINEAIFSKLCILGDGVEPCFEGARIIPQFSLEKDFKQKMYNVINQFKNYTNWGGEKPKMDLEQLNAELVKAKTDFELLTKEHEDLKVKLNNSDSQVAEYTKKYNDLNDVMNDLQVKFNALEDEAKELRKFKKNVELKEKEDMINSFSMLPDEDKVEVKEHINEYSLEEIESKLAVTCFRKKINYTKEETTVEPESTPTPAPLIYSLDGGSGNQGREVPEWVQAVKQKEQELFN